MKLLKKTQKKRNLTLNNSHLQENNPIVVIDFGEEE